MNNKLRCIWIYENATAFVTNTIIYFSHFQKYIFALSLILVWMMFFLFSIFLFVYCYQKFRQDLFYRVSVGKKNTCSFPDSLVEKTEYREQVLIFQDKIDSHFHLDSVKLPKFFLKLF